MGEAVRGGPVAPGTGWPDDPADAATPVAASPADVRSLAAGSAGLAELTARQSVCRACPRLVAWREDVAAVRRKSFMDEPYWGRPIPGWGDPEPAILILGLAPAAHGGNRTGRIFTGDRSGDFLFASLHRCGLAAKPTSVTAGDGQRLTGVRMAAAVRCAPPENKPLPEERDACAPWLAAEFQLITPTLRVVVCLGGFAWQALWPVLAECGYLAPRPRPAFGHGVQVRVSGPAARPLLLLGCYHPSQQNTFTGRVTPAMTDAVFQAAREAAGLGLRPPRRPPDAPARAPRRGWRRGSETFASPQPRPGRVPAASRDDRRSPKSSSGQVMRIQGNIGRHDTPPIGDRRRWRLNCLLAARIRLPGCVPYLRI